MLTSEFNKNIRPEFVRELEFAFLCTQQRNIQKSLASTKPIHTNEPSKYHQFFLVLFASHLHQHERERKKITFGSCVVFSILSWISFDASCFFLFLFGDFDAETSSSLHCNSDTDSNKVSGAHKCGDPIAKLQFYGSIRYSITTIVTFIFISMSFFLSLSLFIADVLLSLAIAKSLHKTYKVRTFVHLQQWQQSEFVCVCSSLSLLELRVIPLTRIEWPAVCRWCHWACRSWRMQARNFRTHKEEEKFDVP